MLIPRYEAHSGRSGNISKREDDDEDDDNEDDSPSPQKKLELVPPSRS